MADSDNMSGTVKYDVMRKQISRVIGCAVALSLLCLAATAQAREKREPLRTASVIREIEGEISFIRRNYISVIYRRDEVKREEYEMVLPVSADIQLTRVEDLGQLKIGDVVRVRYEEVTEEYREGPRQSRRAKAISFLEPAQGGSEPAEPEAGTTEGIKRQEPRQGEIYGTDDQG